MLYKFVFTTEHADNMNFKELQYKARIINHPSLSKIKQIDVPEELKYYLKLAKAEKARRNHYTSRDILYSSRCVVKPHAQPERYKQPSVHNYVQTFLKRKTNALKQQNFTIK